MIGISTILERILNKLGDECPDCGSKDYVSEYVSSVGIQNFYRKLMLEDSFDVLYGSETSDRTLKFECGCCHKNWFF